MVKRGMFRSISIFVIAFMFVVAGCTGGQTNSKTEVSPGNAVQKDEKITIEFWNGHTGPDGKVMATLVQDFQKSHPNIQINIQSLPWDEMFTKAQLAIKSGSGPDIVTMPLDRMISYKDSMFKPIDDLVKGNIKAADFDENLWSKTLFDGKQYGIPLDTHPYVLYYRPDLFKKAGLEPLPKDRPITKAEFEKYANALTTDTVKGFAFKQTAIHSFWDFWGFFLQNGGSMFNSDQTKSAFNSKAAKDTLQYLISLQDEKKVVSEGVMDWKTAFSRFNDGSVAMLLHGAWLIPALEEAKTPYETAMVPQLGSGEYAAFANMHVFAFTRTNEAKTKAGMEFVQWIEMTENAVKWGIGSGQVPAQLKAREKYAENPKLAPIAKTAEMMKGKLFMYPYNKKGDTMIYKYIVPSLEGVYSKTMTIDQALGNIDKGINESLK